MALYCHCPLYLFLNGTDMLFLPTDILEFAVNTEQCSLKQIEFM